MKKTISIVGAGLVGSLWAILLAKKGYRVDLFERRGDMRQAGFVGGRSINLAMSTRGWRALELAGIKKDIRQTALPMYGRMMHSVEGELTYQAYGQEGQAIYSVSRGGLNLKLLQLADAFENVNLHFEHRCQKIDLDTNTLTFNTPDGRVTHQSDLIFGADGAFSAVRSVLQKTPRFNYSQNYLTHGYKEVTIPPAADGTHQLDPTEALHIWPRGHFMLIALPNPDGSFTGTLFLPFEGEQSFEHLTDAASVQGFFEQWFGDAVPLMPDLLEDWKNNPTSSLVTIRCAPWTYKKRVMLIGDASHAIVPFYGQGMNSGFEDCSILHDLHEQLEGDWDRIFDTFNESRIQDADAIADLAIRNFEEMRDRVGDPDFLLRKKIAAWLQERYPDRFLPLYSQVTFSHIPYHRALAEGQRQDALFEKILALPNIHEDWRNDRVIGVFEEWLESKPNPKMENV